MFAIIPLVVVALAGFGQTDACSCINRTPRKKFCSGDFAVGIKVLDGGKLIGSDKVYKIKIIKTYRMNKKKGTVLIKNRLWTGALDAMCGLSLEKGKYYVLSGRLVYIYPGKSKISSPFRPFQSLGALNWARMRGNICLYVRRFKFLFGLTMFKPPQCINKGLRVIAKVKKLSNKG